jgi:hypothetical protein
MFFKPVIARLARLRWERSDEAIHLKFLLDRHVAMLPPEAGKPRDDNFKK